MNLTYQMFLAKVNNDPSPESVLSEIKTKKNLYVLISAEESPFYLCCANKKTAAVFLHEKEALSFKEEMAARQKPMFLKEGSYDSIQKLIAECRQRDELYHVRFYGRSPIFLDFAIDVIFSPTQESDCDLKTSTKEAPQQEESEPKMQPHGELREQLVALLNSSDRSSISQSPIYSIFEKFPFILEKLMIDEHYSAEELNRAVGLPENVIQQFISKENIDIPRETLRKILAVFGLEPYLYRYKNYSAELRTELQRNPHLCKYEIKPAKVSTVERFTLKKIRRTKINAQQRFYLYQLEFESKHRKEICSVTTPLGFCEGKDYELVNLDPIPDEKDPDSATAKVPTAPLKNADEIAKKLEELGKKTTADYTALRKKYVLKYLKTRDSKIQSMNSIELEALYKEMARYDDLLDEFFWKIKPTGDIAKDLEQNEEFIRRSHEKRGPVKCGTYTAEELKREFRIRSVYETYKWMIDLRRSPRETKQRLKMLQEEKGSTGK